MNKLVKEYQCPGCARGPTDNHDCYQESQDTITCNSHVAGTRTECYKFILGLPKGFCRIGDNKNPVVIFNKWKDCNWFKDECIFNIPVWFHINKADHTLIRAYQPRINKGYTLVIGENVEKRLPKNCIKITDKLISEMD
jgi:hypothetical protein